MIDEKIASVVNRALFQQQTKAHVSIMNAKRNARSTITAFTHQNANAEVAPHYKDFIIQVARSVDQGVMDVEGNEL